MEIEVFTYRVWDIQNDTYIIPPRMASREHVARSNGEVFENSIRRIDEHLVDGNGTALLDPGSDESRLLRDLYERGGKASITGNRDRSAMQNLELMRMVSHFCPSSDRVDYEITQLGRAAVEQLLT